MQKNGELLYRDRGHLRASFIREHASFYRTLRKNE
jgi:hypothetical protein